MTVTDWSTWTLPDPPADWPAELPDHLSASQLSMLERCPEQYRRRYVLGQRDRPSASLVWGTVDGKAHQTANFAQKIESHEDAPVEQVREAFAGLLDKEVEDYGGAGEVDWRDETPATVKDRGVALVAEYHRQVSPRIQPTAVEEHVSVDVPGVAVPVIGYVDVSTEHLSIERKTSSQSSKVIPPQYQFQALFYALARNLPVEVHISTRTLKPAVVTPAENPALMLDLLPSTPKRAVRIIQSRSRYLLSLYETFGPDTAWPDAIGTMAWHTAVCDICGFRPTCEWWT